MKKTLIISISFVFICLTSCKEGDNSNRGTIPEVFYHPEMMNMLDDCLSTVDTIIFIPEAKLNLVSVSVVDTADNNRFVGSINAFSLIGKNVSIGDTVELLKIRYMIRSDLGYEMVAIIK